MNRLRLPGFRRMLVEFTVLFLVVLWAFPGLKIAIDPYWREMAGHCHERSLMCDAMAGARARDHPELNAALHSLAVEYERRVWTVGLYLVSIIG